MIFDICISVVMVAAVTALAVYVKGTRIASEKTDERASALALQLAGLKQRLDATETLLSELKTQLEDLDPQAGIDAEQLEKAFNEGVQRIMNYSLTTAMGGGMNG